MTENSSQENIPPQVLIVGAGLGGLMLGAILETANINYHILERAAEVRPLGNCGYDCYILARPKLYDLIRCRVPAHKISMGKKVVRTKEENDKVTVYCSDDTTYECSILVGADGAYSTVRQSMYKDLEELGKIPSSDKEDFSVGFVTMVGVANPPNPEKYPELSDKRRTHFRLLLGNDKGSVSTKSIGSSAITVSNNQICWAIQTQLSSTKKKDQQFRNSEWVAESIDAMMKDFEDYSCPMGGAMKEMFDATPKELVSKVFLEEKIFQTWHHGRSVLIGDACHKLLPGGGQGAVMAMKDAVVLANCIYKMKDSSSSSVKSAFESYYEQRFPEADVQFRSSTLMSKVMGGQVCIPF
ncbi:hypothetical protein BGZ46_001123 [Entomortierella lignicola]|nr:hypothetical protein BGZ46_001123 [Entomortierella lignicola]